MYSPDKIDVSIHGFNSVHEIHVQVDWLVYISYCAVDQILTHSFATLLLSLRYAFREAKNCILSGEYMYVFNTRGTV